MKVVCPACNARYRLPDDRVRGKVLKIRCKSCGHIFQVRDPNTKATDSASIRSRSTRASGAFGAIDDSRKTDSAPNKSLETSTGSFSDERIWYYSINGESYGPYRESELFARFQGGRIGSETYVWTEGFEQWKLATEEERFDEALKQSAKDAAEPTEDPEPTDDLEPTEDSEPVEEKKATRRKPRDCRASKTMSLDAVQLNEQLQEERHEDETEQEEQSDSTGDAASAVTKDEVPDNQNLHDTLSSDTFGDEVEDALDQMFSGGEPATSTSEPTAEGASSEADDAQPPTADSKQPEVSSADDDQSTDGEDEDDSLAHLKSFLAQSRKERRRRTSKNKAIVAPDAPETSEPSASDVTAPSPPDTSSIEGDEPGAEERTKEAAKADASSDTSKKSKKADVSSGSGAAAKASSSTSGTDEDRDDDDSINLAELLAGDLTGTGFGAETAAHAAVDDSKDEPESSRKSNLPLLLIIIVLLLGIVFVVIELTSDDAPTDPSADEQRQEEATVGPGTTPNRALTASEIRDRRLCISSAYAAVNTAAGEAAKAAFNAVPDEIRNPEAARRAQAARNTQGRTERYRQQPQAAEPDPPRLDDPSVAFAQPTLGRGDDGGGGPSRQAFANGLNTFVQQSVFQCQQVHMRREGELAIARVGVSIRVNPDGTVSRVSVPSQIAATAFANCLQSQARNWRFSPFAGDSVTIERTYIIQ